MSTVALDFVPMPKMKTDAAGDADGAKMTRVPVRLTIEQHDKLRELCLIRLRRPIEAVAGEWVAERLQAELKKPSRDR